MVGWLDGTEIFEYTPEPSGPKTRAKRGHAIAPLGKNKGGLKQFIPRRHTEGGPIVFTYVLFCVRKRILDFQFVTEKTPFWNLQNVLL